MKHTHVILKLRHNSIRAVARNGNPLVGHTMGIVRNERHNFGGNDVYGSIILIEVVHLNGEVDVLSHKGNGIDKQSGHCGRPFEPVHGVVAYGYCDVVVAHVMLKFLR